MKHFDKLLEESLIVRLKQGDDAAFKVVFDNYWEELYHYAERKIGSNKDAEELVQNVFMDLWEKRERLIITNLFNFLKVCLRNKCIDHLRVKIHEGKYAEYCRLFRNSNSNFTQEVVYLDDLAEQMQAGLKNLPEKSQLVFKLSKFEGFSVREISSKVNLSEKAVEYHLTKAMKTMKACLKDFVLLVLIFSHII